MHQVYVWKNGQKSMLITMRGNVGFDEVSLHDKVKLLVNMFTTYLSNEK